MSRWSTECGCARPPSTPCPLPTTQEDGTSKAGRTGGHRRPQRRCGDHRRAHRLCGRRWPHPGSDLPCGQERGLGGHRFRYRSRDGLRLSGQGVQRQGMALDERTSSPAARQVWSEPIISAKCSASISPSCGITRRAHRGRRDLPPPARSAQSDPIHAGGARDRRFRPD